MATVDFFTPIVDDAYTFGAIAAANAFSDLYAMGATPLLALNLVAWPRDTEMLTLLGEVIRGAGDVSQRANALILGGHSIDDPEPKFGMVAIGEVSPDAVMTNAGARPGDRIVLTKSLGTGILSTALKHGRITESEMAVAIRSMVTLNDGAAAAMRAAGAVVHAATDVTGFGLLGHLHNVLAASGTAARVDAASVPTFADLERHIAEGAVPGGTKRNLEAAESYTTWSGVSDVLKTILADAQTSGGLLMTIEEAATDSLVHALEAASTPEAAVIGQVIEGTPGAIEVRKGA